MLLLVYKVGSDKSVTSNRKNTDLTASPTLIKSSSESIRYFLIFLAKFTDTNTFLLIEGVVV